MKNQFIEAFLVHRGGKDIEPHARCYVKLSEIKNIVCADEGMCCAFYLYKDEMYYLPETSAEELVISINDQ